MEHYYTVQEVHELTGIPKRTLYDAIKAGKLRTVTPNGTTRGMRTTRQWVEGWLGVTNARR